MDNKEFIKKIHYDGKPCVVIHFETKEQAREFLRESVIPNALRKNLYWSEDG